MRYPETVTLTVHVHIHNGDAGEVLARLTTIEERLNDMPTKDDFEALRAGFDETTNRIAAGVTAVADKIAELKTRLDEVLTNAGVSAAEETAILAGLTTIKGQLDATATALEAVGKPEPPVL